MHVCCSRYSEPEFIKANSGIDHPPFYRCEHFFNNSTGRFDGGPCEWTYSYYENLILRSFYYENNKWNPIHVYGGNSLNMISYDGTALPENCSSIKPDPKKGQGPPCEPDTRCCM